MHGSEDGGGSSLSEIIFYAGELITRIEGHSNASWIRRLTFVTTTRMLRWRQLLCSIVSHWVEI